MLPEHSGPYALQGGPRKLIEACPHPRRRIGDPPLQAGEVGMNQHAVALERLFLDEDRVYLSGGGVEQQRGNGIAPGGRTGRGRPHNHHIRAPHSRAFRR